MKLFLTLCLFAGIIVSANAQIPTTHKNFDKARELANAGQYDRAIEILEILQDSLPENHDYKIYLSRVYGWKKDYPKAIDILTPLTEIEDFSREAVQVMVTTQLWTENYE